MKAFIQDRERLLDSANDLLKTSVYAENLVKVVENTPKDKVFTIGVFGGWGTGKSSIIRTAQDKIENSHSDVKFITYDAWKYANDSFRRMFLLKVQQELKMRQTEEMSRFYQSEIAEAEPRTKLSNKGVALFVIVIAIISLILFLIPCVSIEWKVAFPTIGTLGSFLLALLNGCFYELKITYNKPAMFAPEQFEACFKQMMAKCLKKTNWFQKKWGDLKDYVELGDVSVKELDKLVVVIDNIDRCPSDMAYQLLTDVKTFLSNEEYNLVFIVPVDDEALKKHLFRKWNKLIDEDINKEKEEFLRKFFNVTLRIKPHQGTELLHFTHEIDRENNLGYSNDTLGIVAKEFADNPRRIIQLLNNLSSDLALYEDEFVDKCETAICVALILHESYPDFYKDITKDLNVIKMFDTDNINEDYNLRNFMRIAGNVLIETSYDDLQRIFTNTSSIFSDLPGNLKKSVRLFDAEKVIEYVKSNVDKKENLVDYALESMKSEVKYGISSQTSLWIDFFSQLYKAELFGISRFSEIDDELKTYYSISIPVTKKPEELCYMGSQMATVNITNLKDSIIGYLTDEKVEQNKTFSRILKAYFVNYTSEEDCKSIATVVEHYYVDTVIDKDIHFTDIQRKCLFGDSFVQKQIENLPSMNEESRIDDIIWCIRNNTELSSETFTIMFDKFLDLFGPTRGKSKEDYLSFISQIQPFLGVLPNKKLSTELESIYNVVTKPRGIPHTSYSSMPQYDSQRSILDEIDAEEAQAITRFCYEILRITGGVVDVSNAINKLYTLNKRVVVEGALKLHSIGVSIVSLASILVNVNDYNDVKDLSLLEILLSRQDDGSYMIEDNTLKEKIRDLVDNSENSLVEKLLRTLVIDSRISDEVSEYVAVLDSETINSLPLFVSKFAVSTFKRENAETYKDNVNFLILVLQQGNASQKKEVVRLMKDKINNERDLDNVVMVLNHLETEDQRMLRTLVGELEVVKDSEIVGDETKKRIADLISKLSAGIKFTGFKSKR